MTDEKICNLCWTVNDSGFSDMGETKEGKTVLLCHVCVEWALGGMLPNHKKSLAELTSRQLAGTGGSAAEIISRQLAPTGESAKGCARALEFLLWYWSGECDKGPWGDDGYPKDVRAMLEILLGEDRECWGEEIVC